MANDVAPAGAGAGGGGGAQVQLPPSSFDQQMARMNDVPLIHGDAPAETGLAKTGRIPPPPGAGMEQFGAEPDAQDPAELAARAELERGTRRPEEKQLPDPNADPMGQQAKADADALAEWKATNESLTLPDKFMDKLISVPWGDKGETRDVPVAEMQRGYMRQLDYTRSKQEVSQLQRQTQQHNQNMNAFLNDLGQPATMREKLEDIGYGPVLQQVAEAIYAERLTEEKHFYDLKKRGASDDTINFMRERLAGERTLKLEQRASKRREAQFQSQLAQRNNIDQQAEQGKQLTNQLNQLRPAAFKRLGLPDDAMHNNAFEKQFMAILETGGGKNKQLRDVVLAAADAAKQMVEEHKRQMQDLADEEHSRQAGLNSPMSTQRLPGAAPRAGTGVTRAGDRQLGLNDFDAEMARMNGAGR